MPPPIPFAYQWEIPENQLIPLKDKISGLFKSRTISYVSGIEYHFYIYPNGYGEENRGKMQIGLYMKFGDGNSNLSKKMKVQAVFTILIESANISKYVEFYYEQTGGLGQPIIGTKDFYNPEKKFFVDGKLIIKVYGTFKFETSDAIEKQKWNGAVLGDKLWEKDESKDFTISVENKEIKDKVESHLIDQISAANVCRLSNVSIISNSTKLENKCKKSLMAFIESKTALSDIEILPNQIAVKILQNMLYRSL
uniref:Uncharacterized protein n=1 Tax=Panagrolaimus davidi TaxID=227884 RepID=A0A914PGF2_9BILA